MNIRGGNVNLRGPAFFPQVTMVPVSIHDLHSLCNHAASHGSFSSSLHHIHEDVG